MLAIHKLSVQLKSNLVDPIISIMSSTTTKTFQRGDRPVVKSAIQSIPLTLSSLPARPTASSSSGQASQLYTNHFNCSFTENLPLYQYDVIVEGLGSKSNEWFEIKGRKRCAAVMQMLVTEGAFGANEPVWYDEQRCLYSTSILNTPRTCMTSDGQQKMQILSLANQWSTKDIYDYIHHRASNFPYDSVRILETLLKKSVGNRIHVVNNTCYFTDERPTILTGKFEERLGFSQALNLASGRITLNVQTKLTTFYPEMNLLDFIQEQLGHSGVPDESECKRLTGILRNCLVVTQQSNWKQAYEIDRFDSRRPEEIFIESGKNLIEFYRDEKKIKLKKTNYPCIQVYLPNEYQKACHLPLEVCRIQAWQVFDRPLAKANDRNQPQKRIPKPEQRYAAIMNCLRRCEYNAASNRLCRAVGFKVDESEMLKLNARILTQPQIQNGPNQRARVHIGRIPLDGHVFTPRPLSALAITYFGNNFESVKRTFDQFKQSLIQSLNTYHVDVRYVEHTVQPTIDQIDGYFKTMQQCGCQFVVCVMHTRTEEERNQLKLNIKDCGTIKYGIMTQCADLNKIAANRSVTSYCDNLIRKINFKNAGINTKVDLDVALKNKKSKKDAWMFFGADVIHPTNVTRQHPSIAAVVGSGDSLCSTSAARVCQQYPKQGKCSIETIVGLTEMVQDLLDYYRQANKVLPNKVVFYRDGVDDGQFGKVIAHEIPLIREAFNLVYGDKSNHPLLSLIVVKKRHNTRFFAYNQETSVTSNLAIGAAIDTTIVHPYQNNFYLNSHTAFQGVNHPSLYHVLLDEIHFTVDELQLLTYHLCFTDPRSSAAEAIPSVVHHADIAALKARDLFYNDDSSSAMSVGGRSRPLADPTLDDIEYKILDVHENLRNRPVFG